MRDSDEEKKISLLSLKVYINNLNKQKNNSIEWCNAFTPYALYTSTDGTCQQISTFVR